MFSTVGYATIIHENQKKVKDIYLTFRCQVREKEFSMTTLTIQTELEKRYWYVAIDGKEHRKLLAHNGSDNRGRSQAQRKLAQLVED